MQFMKMAQMIEYYMLFALGLAIVALAVWALVDCLRHPADRFIQEGKRTKGFWTGLTAGSAAVGALALFGSGLPTLMLFQLAAVSVASVYLADVKPALNELKGSGGSAYGPYGSW